MFLNYKRILNSKKKYSQSEFKNKEIIILDLIFTYLKKKKKFNKQEKIIISKELLFPNKNYVISQKYLCYLHYNHISNESKGFAGIKIL